MLDPNGTVGNLTFGADVVLEGQNVTIVEESTNYTLLYVMVGVTPCLLCLLCLLRWRYRRRYNKLRGQAKEALQKAVAAEETLRRQTILMVKQAPSAPGMLVRSGTRALNRQATRSTIIPVGLLRRQTRRSIGIEPCDDRMHAQPSPTSQVQDVLPKFEPTNARWAATSWRLPAADQTGYLGSKDIAIVEGDAGALREALEYELQKTRADLEAANARAEAAVAAAEMARAESAMLHSEIRRAKVEVKEAREAVAAGAAGALPGTTAPLSRCTRDSESQTGSAPLPRLRADKRLSESTTQTERWLLGAFNATGTQTNEIKAEHGSQTSGAQLTCTAEAHTVYETETLPQDSSAVSHCVTPSTAPPEHNFAAATQSPAVLVEQLPSPRLPLNPRISGPDARRLLRIDSRPLATLSRPTSASSSTGLLATQQSVHRAATSQPQLLVTSRRPTTAPDPGISNNVCTGSSLGLGAVEGRAFSRPASAAGAKLEPLHQQQAHAQEFTCRLACKWPSRRSFVQTRIQRIVEPRSTQPSTSYPSS